MADRALYVRVRGKVTGPFGIPQLLSLRDRGQLRRFHEVSEDRQHWQSAANLTDVFPPEASQAPVDFDAHITAAPQNPGRPTESSAPEAAWMYVDAQGNRQGPIPESQLISLWHSGAIADTGLVWKNGLADWAAIATVGLAKGQRGLAGRIGTKRWLLATAACLLILAVGAGAITLVLAGKSAITGDPLNVFAGDALKDDAKYFPSTTSLIVSVRVDKIRGSKLYKDIGTDVGAIAMGEYEGEVEKRTGIAPANIERVTLAGVSDLEEGVIVVRTKQPIHANEIISAVKKQTANARFAESNFAGKTIHESASPGHLSFCGTDSKVVVFAKAALLKTVLERGKAPEFSERLKQARQAVDFDKPITFAGDMRGPAFIGLWTPDRDIPPPDYFFGFIDVTADLSLSYTFAYKDGDAAADAMRQAQGSLDEYKKKPGGEDLLDLFDSRLKVSSNKVNMELTVGGPSLARLVRKEIRKGLKR